MCKSFISKKEKQTVEAFRSVQGETSGRMEFPILQFPRNSFPALSNEIGLVPRNIFTFPNISQPVRDITCSGLLGGLERCLKFSVQKLELFKNLKDGSSNPYITKNLVVSLISPPLESLWRKLQTSIDLIHNIAVYVSKKILKLLWWWLKRFYHTRKKKLTTIPLSLNNPSVFKLQIFLSVICNSNRSYEPGSKKGQHTVVGCHVLSAF